MNKLELKNRLVLRNNYPLYARKILRIKAREGSKPLIFNKTQLYIHEQLEKQLKETGKVRALILKGRQQGVSTYVGGRFYHKVTHTPGCQAYIIAHDGETTRSLFNMSLRFYDNTPAKLKRSCSQKTQNRIVFDKIDSEYRIGTAGSVEAGRGLTIRFLHGSEVAMWPDGGATSQGLFQAVPRIDGTEIILESTAKGMNNFFYQQCEAAMKSEGDFILIFCPWYWEESYRATPPGDFELTKEEIELKDLYKIDNNQLYWRRLKIVEMSSDGADGVWKFRQEYPFTAVEAFLVSSENSFIKENDILRARKFKIEKATKDKIILGVDPAPTNDETAMIFRKGKKVFGLKTFKKLSGMAIAGILNKTLKENTGIWRVYVDYGYGIDIVERLRELGHKNVFAVQFGSAANDHEKYANKRAEMYGLLRQDLHDGEYELPDDNILHQDLSAQMQKMTSEQRIMLVSKDTLIKKLKRSPDRGDALALTYAGIGYDIGVF